MHFLFFILFFLLTVNINAQTYRIDSIKKLLPSLNGPAEINALNALGNEFYFYWVHADSALKYTRLAYQKAEKIRYVSGKAESLLITAGIKGRLLGRPVEMEDHARTAIKILGKVKDPKTFSMAFYYLGVALTIQGKYHLAKDPAEKAKQFALEARDPFAIGWAEEGIGFMYFKSGKFWKSFEHLIEAQQIGRDINDSVLTSLSLAIIARTFNLTGDPQTALNYYYQAFEYGIPFIRLWGHHEDMAYAHLRLKQYDSAMYYQQLNNKQRETMTTDPNVRKKFASFSIGYSIDIQLARKQYDSVLAQVLPAVQKLRGTGDVVPYMQSLFILGKVFHGKAEYQKSLRYTRELYQMAREVSNKRLLKDANELLASVFSELKQGDSAYYYFKQFTVLNDSMETAQYASRTALHLAASASENKIRLLNKDKEIREQQLALNKKELQKQAQLKNMLLAGLGILLLLTVLVFRNNILKRKNENLRNEKEQSALKGKAMELEMQALRAQMNPHFIFNCLSAIDNLIQTNQADKATTCLSRFAKLIRGVLDSSKNNLVPFQRDFETMQLYLEMEQFRCNNKFSYVLYADTELMQSDFKVPPLIIQPFIENAIHHGLLNKQSGNRELRVDAQLKEDHIVYSITDNGIGRKMAAQIKERNRPGQQSYGIQITKERIQLHNRNGITNDLLIHDLENEGIPMGTQTVVQIACYQ